MAAAMEQQQKAPPLSAKALGKRPATAADESVAAPSSAASKPGTPVLKTKERVKRVTRSSLGGSGSGAGPLSREGSATLNEAIAPPLYLPRSTPVLLCMTAPATGLTHYPPLLLPADALTAAEEDEKVVEDPNRPPFRLLEVGDAFGRSRHAGAAETDTSDAYYHRLHRFPEVLEKRSARLERERLIHERSKLILELEELRGRGWVYQGAQGGKGEEERRRKIKEGEDRLQRYDALLPNQPRKSNFLNNGPHSVANDSHSRAGSPAVPSAPPRAQSRRQQDPYRHSTPLSASGDGSTTIRIKFGANGARRPNSTTTRGGQSKQRSRISYAEADTDDEEEDEEGERDYYYEHEPAPSRSGKGQKRDRAAEKARAQERVRLGYPARSSYPVNISDRIETIKRRRRRSKSEEEDEEADSEDNDEEPDGDAEDRHHETRPRHSVQLQSRRRRTSRGEHRRIRLPDSFFHTEASRDLYLSTLQPSDPGAPGSSRRSSSRLAFAFGQRLPDAALLRYQEFELFGGVAEDETDQETGNTGRRLEDMVVERLGVANAEVLGGRVVPKSALDAERRGPIVIRQEQFNGGGAAAVPPAPQVPAFEATPPPSAASSARSRRRTSASRQANSFVAPRLSPQRPSVPRNLGHGDILGPPSASGPLPVPPAAAIALGWTGPGRNESSSSLTSLQLSSTEDEGGADTPKLDGDEDGMVLG